METSVTKKRLRAEIPPHAVIIDLDAIPSPKLTGSASDRQIKQEEVDINGVIIKTEPDEKPELPHGPRFALNCPESPVALDDDDEPRKLGDSPAPKENTGQDLPFQPDDTPVLGLTTQPLVPESAGKERTSTIDPLNNATINQLASEAGITAGATGPRPVQRISNQTYRDRLNHAKKQAAAKIAARNEEAKKAAQAANAAGKPPTLGGEAGSSSRQSLHKTKQAIGSTDDGMTDVAGPRRQKVNEPAARNKRRVPAKRASGDQGYLSGSSDIGDDCNKSDSDDGLFVRPERKAIDEPENDEMDIDENSEAQQLTEENEHKKRSKEYKRKKRIIDRKKKNEELSIEEEIEWMQYEREYEVLIRKQQEDQERETRAQSEAELHDEDIDSDDDLFERFEDRNAAVNQTEPDDEFPDDEDDMLNHYDKVAKARRNKRKASMLDNSDDESGEALVGKRKRKAGGTRQPRKSQAGNGKAKKKGKSKDTNDRVQDKNAKVTKKNAKTKTKKFPTLDQGHSMLNVGSLLSGNVVRDAALHGEAGGLPGFTKGNKQDALKALIASLPADAKKQAQTDKKAVIAAMNDFVGHGPVRVVQSEENLYHLRGMVSHLKPHQLLGAAFMRRRERDVVEPRGGICSDQMGLGKTVMMLANIINGLPGKKNPGPRTTLIVAPVPLVDQWNTEIQKHCGSKALKVQLWDAKSKARTNFDARLLEGNDIVITTYYEVMRSYPKADIPIELQTAEAKDRWWRDFYNENRGPLHEARFLRVVLDEAQAIKNHQSHTSIACRGINATHRWALSGTPIQNNLRELYPYFKFLKVEHTGTYKLFCNNFIGTEKLASATGVERLNQLLGRFMIRRTHADKVMGHRVVTLPKASQQIRWCKFNDVERAIYEIVRARMIERINKLSRSRMLDANYSNVLTMLLRLRQLTGHLLMLQRPMEDLLEREDHEKIVDLAQIEIQNNQRPLRARHLKRLRELIAKGARQGARQDDKTLPSRARFDGVEDSTEQADCPTEMEDDRHDSGTEALQDRENIGHSHGLKYNFLKYLKTLREGSNMRELVSRTVCVACNDRPEEPVITSCYHIYCHDCLDGMMADSAESGQDCSRCMQCGIEFEGVKSCDAFDLEEIEENLAVDDSSDTDTVLQTKDQHHKKNNKKKKAKGKKNKKKQFKDQDKDDWIDQEGFDILPSAKTLEIKAQVLNWISENPNCKIIIYTQFIDMIRILAKVCHAERWVYTRYYGGMSLQARQNAIKAFQNDANIRILLSSLKAGGIGLNLTMAQKVIVVDPWWNSSVEQQAFCRVFRIGQEHETSLTRFVVKDTVDQHMIEMQERKQAEIDQVMGGKRRNLSVVELLQLFGGEMGEDEDGQPFIFSERKDTLINPLGDDEDMQDDV